MAKTFVIDVLRHTVRVPAGTVVDGVALTAPAFLDVGCRTVVGDVDFATLEAAGHVEIVSVDGGDVVWDACCVGHEAAE